MEERETYHINPDNPQANRAKKRLLRTLIVVGPVVGAILLIAICAENRQSITVGDENADGIVNVLDVRALKGEDWLVGLDFNDDSVIDDKDKGLVAMRVGTRSAVPLFNIDGKDGITCDDVAIVERHLGETVEADSNSRLLRDTAYYANRMVILFGQGTPQEKIDNLVKQRQYNNLNQQPLSLLKKILVIAEIPEKVLTASNLDEEIEEVSQENGVISADKFYIDPVDDIIGKSQPCP